MRSVGTKALGIRLPIINKDDNLPEIVTDSIIKAAEEENLKFKSGDVIGITEAIVAKSQGNFASISDIAEDVKIKYPGGVVGVVFPILSRNRFANILKGIAKGAKKVYVLLAYPKDEEGNPILDINSIDEIESQITQTPIPAKSFKEISNNYAHPFTDINYISLYEEIGDNIEVYVSKDPRDILKLTEHVLVCEIHNRTITKNRLLKAGAKTAYGLTDILSAPVNGSGYNPDYGVLGSNISTGSALKLFPRDCDLFVQKVKELFFKKTGINAEVLVYGDGAFKDPLYGIWELADPVVSPGHTERLKGFPNEIKLKYVADNLFSHMDKDEQKKAITQMIKDKKENTSNNEGTTPRQYADLLGSLCDLMSGSGDKGTPVIYIQGYFDDYSAE